MDEETATLQSNTEIPFKNLGNQIVENNLSLA
jgi:hypothetical protein